MRISVLLFASAREAVGSASVEVALPASATVSDVLREPRLAGLAGLAPSLRFALNEEFARPEAPLREGDVVALLPPVSGG